MQIRQQIIDLLLREFLAVARHLVATVPDQVPGTLIVCRHSAYRKVLFSKHTLEARPLPLTRRVGFVAAITILVVNMPAGSLLRI